MTETERPYIVIAQAYAVTMSRRPGPRPVEIPGELPGVVIVLHGVNDPGANYGNIEQGLCEGLNERLRRIDLRSGIYGESFKKAVQYTHGSPDFDKWKKIKYDPDTYEYQRTVIKKGKERTHSVMIPFYWGYRALSNHIRGGEKNPVTLRGQYQDRFGNRLSKNFAKGGGMFNNATTNIAQMYEAGWRDTMLNKVSGAFMSGYQYSSASPDRSYQVLAATRLAMLIREIRRADPDETVTVLAHSQGSVIALLAQAMLAESDEEGSRCADCLIMVDSPYSLTEPALARLVQPDAVPYTIRGRLNTLINIVRAVTGQPHDKPKLEELVCDDGNPLHRGRTGRSWSPADAVRRDKDGRLYPFAERDNRGKVYLYFCTDDTTVDLPNIKGIGRWGVPDTVEEVWVGSRNGRPTGLRRAKWKAMDSLRQFRFYQRLWSKVSVDARGRPRRVGYPPGHYDGSGGKDTWCCINAEELNPPHEANLYGGEAQRGTEKKAGKDRPDYVLRDTLLGNPDAHVRFVRIANIPERVRVRGPKAVAGWFNSQSPDPEDHTDVVKAADEAGLTFVREETPNETRARLEHDSGDWDCNSYHSAILRHPDNIRRVAAMDVAIGQARCLDDPNVRELLIAVADWKLTTRQLKPLQDNPYYRRLLQTSRDLIEQSAEYYSRGTFPIVVSMKLPRMVDAETFTDRENRKP